MNTVFEEGKFYTQPQLKNFVYHCEKIEGEFATMLLLRSYQHGHLVRMEMKEPTRTSKDYVEITDEAEIELARKLHKEFVELRMNNPPQATNEVAKIWLTQIEDDPGVGQN